MASDLVLFNTESTVKDSSSSDKPSISKLPTKKQGLSLGIHFDNDKVKYDGNYSDSGDDSESDQGNDAADDDDLGEDEDFDTDYSSLKQSQKSSSQASKQQQNKKPTTKKLPAKQNLNLRKSFQLVMNVSDTQYPVVRFVGKKLFKWKLSYDADNQDCDLFWTDNAVQPETLGHMSPHQKINHFPGMFSLARKNYLARNLKKMMKQFPSEYKFFPQTWLLPYEYNDLRNEFEKTSKGKCKTFIVKPEASCQGKGIFLTRNLEDLTNSDHYVVQRYLNKPFLIEGLKFDFRIYVLLAGCDPMRIYVFKEGLARLSTEKYEAPNRDNLDNLCMHLTNYAINKDNPNFEFNKDDKNMGVGHKRSMTSAMELLAEQGHDVVKLWDDIKDIIIKTIVSAQPTLSHHYKSCQPDNYINNMCFEILGIDVIIDENLRPWLLEINHTPSFTTDTPLDSLIKKNCIRDTIILMNINNKTRNEIINTRKEQLQKRVLTGKKLKLSPEEKVEEIKKGQAKREEWEMNHLGNFEKVYPLQHGVEDIYLEMLQHSHLLYENQTGANIRRVSKKEVAPNQIGVMQFSINSKSNIGQQRSSLVKQQSDAIQVRQPKPKTVIASRFPGVQPRLPHMCISQLGKQANGSTNMLLSEILIGEDGQIKGGIETFNSREASSREQQFGDSMSNAFKHGSSGGGLFLKPWSPIVTVANIQNQVMVPSQVSKYPSSQSPQTSLSTQFEIQRMQNIKKYAQFSQIKKISSNNCNENTLIYTINTNDSELQPSFNQSVSNNYQNQTLITFINAQNDVVNTQSQTQNPFCVNNSVRQILANSGYQQQQQLNINSKVLPGIMRNTKLMQNGMASNSNNNYNGLFLQPKLFDLNILTRGISEEDQSKKEGMQSIRISAPPQKQMINSNIILGNCNSQVTTNFELVTLPKQLAVNNYANRRK